MYNRRKTKYQWTVCKVCGADESKASNGDLDWCSECYATEQGFIYLEETEVLGVLQDEDGNLYNDNYEPLSKAKNNRINV